jgi:UDPglucose 6-dehydrogenase
MKITVVGTGYVGLSNAVLLSQNNEVIALDVVKEKVDLINKRVSPIGDNEIEDFFANKELNLTATLDKEFAYKDCDIVVIATPTDYDPEKNFFDTSSVDSVIEDVKKYTPNSTVIIKSTVPVGYTQKMQDKYPDLDIIFSPEFLREGKALYDNLYPSRIIMGKHSKEAEVFANLLVEGALKEDIEVLYTNPTEAEAIKLFSNTYLAMRVSYFNELDTYAEVMNLDSEEIIKGVGLDPRIGSHYNNPSFGYGGYCLPKDTKQMLADYENIPQEMISAIVNSNQTRKEHIANMVLSKKPKVVGVYRLIMKTGSDNFRASSIIDVMNIIKDEGVKVVIFEPGLKEEELYGIDVLRDINEFKEISDIIITNRFFKELEDVKNKVYTRDIFNRD